MLFDPLALVASRELSNQSTYILKKKLALSKTCKEKSSQLSRSFANWRCRAHAGAHVEEVEPARRMMQSATIVSCTRPRRPQFRWQVGGALSRFHHLQVSSAETTRKRWQVDLPKGSHWAP